MPNWKSQESTVRLLSAIIAAHPELKLKYDGKPNTFPSFIPVTVVQSLCFFALLLCCSAAISLLFLV
jgi:hypothetical protein